MNEPEPLSLGRAFGLVGGFFGALVWVPASLFAIYHVGGWWPFKITLIASALIFANCCFLARWSYAGVPRQHHKKHGQSYRLFAVLYILAQIMGALVVWHLVTLR